MYKFFNWFKGRHTAFCVAFFVSGNVFHYYHRLDATYITFMGTLMGFVLGHSTQENYFKKDDPVSADTKVEGNST